METGNSVRVSGSKRKRSLQCEASIADTERQSKIARVSPCPCCSTRSVIRNHANFVKSRPPRRVMFYDDGEWHDFPENVMASVVHAFRVRRLVVEVSMRNCIYLVDFVHMVMINLKTEAQQSVAWIDEAEKCFFPEVFFGSEDRLSKSDEIKVKVEIQICGPNNSEPEHKMILNSQSEDIEVSSEIKEVIAENGALISNGFGFECFNEKLVRLERGGDDYITVQNLFLTGFGTLVTANNVMGIQRYVPTDCAALARLRSFEEQIKIMKSCRGVANVRRGWYGSSKDVVSGILLHGFGRSEKPLEGVAHGTGVYLTPEDCSHASVKFCDADENGAQHMVLCRIIMGSMEQVQPGSEQFHPSCEDFDSGVDNIQNPRLYVIWSTHMNTHIHPEYVVSFKLTPDRVPLAGLKDIQSNLDVAKDNDQKATSMVRDGQNSTSVSAPVKLPTSTWMPFSMLFDAIQTSISPSAKDLLESHYNAFKSKKMTREELIQKLRSIAGDKLLRSTLKQFQCNPDMLPAVCSANANA